MDEADDLRFVRAGEHFLVFLDQSDEAICSTVCVVLNVIRHTIGISHAFLLFWSRFTDPRLRKRSFAASRMNWRSADGAALCCWL